MKLFTVLSFTFILVCSRLDAQILYVSAQKGNDDAVGTATAPLKSLQRAASIARSFSGNEPVTIRLGPGVL